MTGKSGEHEPAMAQTTMTIMKKTVTPMMMTTMMTTMTMTTAMLMVPDSQCTVASV